ncbi:MAG: hypothetical protein WD696_03495 [Bryobacteraceae bacterium]
MSKLYGSLADWWPLLSPPADYFEEAAIYAKHLVSAGNQPSRTMIEFGSGGGNNASHLKTAEVVPFEHSEIEPGSMELFLGVKPDK